MTKMFKMSFLWENGSGEKYETENETHESKVRAKSV